VTDAGLNLQRLVVVYENGEPERIDVRANIPRGGESRQIDLRGAGKRRIRSIDFWYDTKGILNGKACDCLRNEMKLLSCWDSILSCEYEQKRI
jgi:hypothetical protein